MQKPLGPSDEYCRYWRKPMSKVCHVCSMWTRIEGTNPNTGERVDDWRCAEAWTPVLLMEIAQKLNQQGAAIESMRNEQAKRDAAAINLALGRISAPSTRLLEAPEADARRPRLDG